MKTIPNTMKAIAMLDALPIGQPESLVDLDLPVPAPGSRDLLVEVRAVSVDPVDAKVRNRERPPSPPPRVLGWDAAGVVVAVGAEVTAFRPGDEVWFAGDITRPGANSEYCLVDERIAGPKPGTLDFAESAAMPLTTITAHEALFTRMHLARGEESRGKSLLVVGGAGGVGSIAVQLAKVLTGVTVIASASRDESRAWVEALGADHVVDHRSDLRPQLARLGFEHVDYVLCTADTDPYYAALVDLVAPQGVVCFIVPPTKPVDMAPLHPKSAAVVWELMYTRSMFQTKDMAEQGKLLAEVANLVDAGRIRSTLRQRLRPLCAATLRQAHTRIESGTTIGKIALEGW